MYSELQEVNTLLNTSGVQLPFCIHVCVAAAECLTLYPSLCLCARGCAKPPGSRSSLTNWLG